MKVIIIEGMDRTGKDSLINEIRTQYDRVLIVHCSTPIGDTELDKIQYQDRLFSKYIDNICYNIYSNVCDCVIFNRAWYGEYVYGQLYRNRTNKSVEQLIAYFEKRLQSIQNDDVDVVYIQLINNSMNLYYNNDDGKSLSMNRENVEKELQLFNKIYDFSTLRKHKIIVNDGDNYRNKEDILAEALNFINED